MKTEAAHELAAELDIDVEEVGICHACLSFVSFAIDDGDEREIRRQTNAMTPVLWAEGLALRGAGRPRARSAAGRSACGGGDRRHREPRARSPVAEAIVRRLGADLADDAAARHRRSFASDA